MRFRVEVQVGSLVSGVVYVDADSEEEAKAEAEEVVRNETVEALSAWECEP